MDVPGIVESTLDGEEVAAEVALGGEDVAFVTPSRTLVYRGEGLLSDESVEEYPHDAERVAVSEGRRKGTIHLDYGLEGDSDLSVPTSRVDDVLHPLLAGVFNAQGVTGSGETVARTYRFSELTLVVTSDRLVKHIGEAVWDEEYEEVPFESVTGIAVEEGDVASQFVLQTGDRTERIKTPNEQARDVRESVQDALFEYYDVASREAFERAVETPDDESAPATDDAGEVTFAESDLDPIESSPPEESADDGFSDSPFETAAAKQASRTDDEVTEQLDALRDALDRQRDLIEKQQATIERLADRINHDR